MSLERLADINPDLLAQIKTAAEGALGSNQSTLPGEPDEGSGDKPPAKRAYFAEIRSEGVLEQSKAWAKVEFKAAEQSKEMIQVLNTCVKDGSSSDSRYLQSDAVDMTHVLAAASAMTTLLAGALQRREAEDKQSKQSLPGDNSQGPRLTTIDKSLFTNNGVKKKNLAVIAMLYEVGLPFVSSSDGRRFKTQLELSKHLDRLFKRR